MDIANINPTELTPDQATGFAQDLVQTNAESLTDVGSMLTGLATDLATVNEDSLSEFYRPAVKAGTTEVKKSQKLLDQLITTAMDAAVSNVAANHGQVQNYVRSLQQTEVSNVGNPTGAVGDRIPAAGNLVLEGPQPTLLPVVRTGPRLSQGPSLGVGPMFPQPVGVGLPPTPSGSGTTPYPVAASPVFQAPGETNQAPGVSVGTGQGPQVQSPVQAIVSPPGSEGSGSVGVGLFGSADTFPSPITIEPGCSGVWWWDPVLEQYRCIECPAGFDVDMTTGKCIKRKIPKPPDCPHDDPIPSQPGQEVAPCPPPPVKCPDGQAWWWNPDQKKYQCTPGGLPPAPPPPKPPDCQQIMDRVQFVMPINCDAIPESLRKNLKDCGFNPCKQEPQDDDVAPSLGPTYQDLLAWLARVIWSPI